MSLHSLMTLAAFLAGMDESTMSLDETQKNLLDAVRFFVGRICEEEMRPKLASHEFVSALAGLCFTLLSDHIPRELLAFAEHAGRKQVQDEDFLLFCRKTSLQDRLREYKEALPQKSPKPPRKKKVANTTIDEILARDWNDSDE